jgi:Rad3-related DNA helicase
MITEQMLLQSFPFPIIREAQAQALEKVARTIQEGKRFSILEMPTGSGKSPVSIAIGMAAAQEPQVDKFQPGAHITTTQIILQRQYMRDFESQGLREIKGKSNYMCCSFDGGGVVDCGTAQTLHSEEEQCGTCTYKLARQEYLDAPIGVTNFAYFTTIRKSGREEAMPSRQILIVDEAHNTEAELIGFGEIDITQSRLDTLEIPKILTIRKDLDVKDKLDAAKVWLADVVLPKVKIKRMHYLAMAHKAQDRHSAVRNVKIAEGLEQFKGRVANFLEAGPDDPWVVYNQLTPQGIPEGLVLKPLYANHLAERYLFSAGKHVVLMSATILGPRVFARNLGIEIEDLGFKRFNSDFPVGNRPVIFDPVGSMSFKNIDNTLPKMAKEVAKIARLHPDQKGMVHTNSYKVTKAIVEHLHSVGLGSRVITHTSSKGSRDDAVAMHIGTPDPTILISPSLTEGLDLAGDLSRWQIITKIPFPSLGDEWIKTRMQLDSEWYTWKTVLTLIQASGRSIRSKKDYAETFILDSDFNRLMNQGSHLFPQWWKDGLTGL